MAAKQKSGSFGIALCVLFIVLAVIVSIVAGIMAPTITSYFTNAFGGAVDNTSVGSGDTEWDLATSTEDKIEAAFEEGYEIDIEMMEEGAVLLKNADNTLPLDKSKTGLDLFGYASFNPLYGGGGSGDGGWDEYCYPTGDAFQISGFTVNTELESWYSDDMGAVREEWSDNAGSGKVSKERYNVPEFTVDQYKTSEDVQNTNNVAVVTFARNGAEGAELPLNMSKYYIDYDFTEYGSADKTYLDPTATELELLEYLNGRYDTIVVLIESSNVMNLSFIEDEKYGVDACLWIGGPGESGLIGVGNLLAGEANPSGHLPDTYAYDFGSMPAFYNGGLTYYSNEYIGPGRQSINVDSGTINHDAWGYYQYEEGIYVGYRWYETAYAEGIKVEAKPYAGVDNFDSVTATTYDFSDYDSIVQFPFGYGGSYTTFEWKVTDSSIDLTAGGENTISVEVTNTGDVAGKDVVQVYMHAPYNDGGIEKAEVVLVGFAKTPEIAAKDSAEVEITFSTDDIASYDYEGWKIEGGGYVLEAGEYEFRIRSDSHNDMTEPVKATLGEDILYTGETHRDSDEKAASNMMDDVSAGDGNMIYLNRSDLVEGWNSIVKDGREDRNIAEGDVAAADWVIDAIETSYIDGRNWTANDSTTVKVPVRVKGGTVEREYTYYFAGANVAGYMETSPEGLSVNDEKYVSLTENIGKGDKGWKITDRFLLDGGERTQTVYTTEAYLEACGISSVEEGGTGDVPTEDEWLEENTYGWEDIAYEDEMWTDLLDQVTLEELITAHGRNSGQGAIDSVGKTASSYSDGPGEAGNGNREKNTWFCSEVVMAATWNVELIERVGVAYGHDCVNYGITSTYAPAMDTHRTPFGGRNFEYYSEDGLLAGKIGAAEVRGIQSVGVGVFCKHFLLNDLDGNRTGAMTWCNEQALREIYSKPYELCAKEGDASGIMASLNRIGVSWAHSGIYLELIRNEWGWHGVTVTDGIGWGGDKYTTGSVACMSGGITTLGTSPVTQYSDRDGDASQNAFGRYMLYENCHRLLYQWVHVGSSEINVAQNNAWIWIVVGVDIALVAAAVLVFVFVVWPRTIKPRLNKNK